MDAHPTGGPWTHRWARVNGVELHYVEAGEGPLVVLLHGFPEFWYAWRYQIPALAAAGFRVLAPDMRGYNLSEKPPGVRSYAVEALTADVAALIRHAGAERAAVAGHDWGGYVAWALPVHHPSVVDRLIVMNAPHPGAWLREAWKPGQLFRSLYQFYFQLPWLPEETLRARDYAAVRLALTYDPVRSDAFTDTDIRLYIDALEQPGALTATLNYYRAMFRRAPFGLKRDMGRIDAPTLLLWGERDPYLVERLTEGLEEWVPDLRVARLPDAGHFVQADAPEEVNRRMIEFLSHPAGTASGDSGV